VGRIGVGNESIGERVDSVDPLRGQPHPAECEHALEIRVDGADAVPLHGYAVLVILRQSASYVG